MSNDNKLDKRTWISAIMLIVISGVILNIIDVLAGEKLSFQYFSPGLFLLAALLKKSKFK